ncbi:MAG: hypothetical protein U0V56_00260 [Actinomycetota bacterium]
MQPQVVGVALVAAVLGLALGAWITSALRRSGRPDAAMSALGSREG